MKPLFVAELSANHLGSMDRAVRLVHAAKAAGADAVKLQTFTPEQMVDASATLKSGPWAGCSLLDLYREAHTPREWHKPLFELIRELGMVAFSSAFHPEDVDFLETLGCPMYKIASFELNDHELISHAARTGKPLVISTGMATLEEISEAACVASLAGCRDLTILKCTSAYPAPASEANLAAMRNLAIIPRCKAFGLSDHTMGHSVALAASVMGASMIEKHLTMARVDGGPDAAFSMEPDEFAEMVTECRRAVDAIGEVRYGPTTAEAAHVSLRRSSGGKRAA